MCMGLPMQVIESGVGGAICQFGSERRRVDTMLVGEQPAGTWLLVFIDAAREVISAEAAERIRNALDSLDSVMKGGTGNVDALFADIIVKREETG